jgi:hypothetical protein
MYEYLLMWKYFVEQFNGNSFILESAIGTPNLLQIALNFEHAI